jgi:hypothetical protein
MSGSVDNVEGGSGFASLGLTQPGSGLMGILMASDIVPGAQPSYELAKLIFVHHPLGGKLAEKPLDVAQSQAREIAVPGGPESRLIPAFQREWRAIGKCGADTIIRNTMTLARVYGIASLAVGDRGKAPNAPLDLEKVAGADLFFNVIDPLNSAGSLVLNQDPNSPDFLKPGTVTVAGQTYHPSRVCVMMNEQPVYIQWTNSAFGFVGRSVYQRALYPLRSYIQSMITDQLVVQKSGLLIAKITVAGSIVNERMRQMFGFKRQTLKDGVTGQVLSIGTGEAIESLNLQNLEGPARMARENILSNIAMAAGMPAKLLEQETMVGGMAEGTEDAKQIAQYIDRLRIEMQPIYGFMDEIVMRRAWSEAFYEALKKEIPEYRKVPYLTAFMSWRNSFTATWPNLLTEPDSEKAKTQDVRFKSVIAMVETMSPLLDPKNKATLAMWAADQANEQKQLFTSQLILDEDAIAEYQPPTAGDGTAGDETKEPEPEPFSSRT